MELRSERFDESSLPNPDGTYDYRYVGTTYIVSTADGRELIFRTYDDDAPGQASMIWPTAWTPAALREAPFREAFRLLREQAGLRAVRLYNPMAGYADLFPLDGEDGTPPEAAT